MLRLVNRRIVACCALIAIGGACVKVQAAAPDRAVQPVELLTPSTALYVELVPPAELLEQGLAEQATAFFEKLPQVRKALESRDFEKIKTAIAHLENKLDVQWRAALPKLAERVTVAFDAAEQAFFVFVDTRDKELLIALHDEVISLIEADADRKGAPSPVKSAEHNGQTGYAFGKKEAHTIIGDTLVVSNSAEALKRLIDRRADLLDEGTAETTKKRRRKTLADDPTFVAARKHAAADDAGFAFVRMAPIRLLAGLAKVLGPTAKSGNFVGELLAGGVLGALESADYLAATLKIDDAGLRLAAHLPHDRAGTLKSRTWFFAPQAGQSAAAPLRANRTIATLTAYRDVGGMWTARNELFDEATNVGLTQADTNLGLYFSGKDFGSQVLGELQPQWRFIAAARTFGDDGQPVPALKLPSFALVWELKNPESFGPHLQMAFQNIIGITNLDGVQKGRPQLLMKTETRGDAEIQYGTYLLAEKPEGDEGPIHFNFRPACARVGKHFVLGTHVGLVRELCDGLARQPSAEAGDDSLALDVRFDELAKSLEANRSLIVGRSMLAAGGDRSEAEAQLDLGLELVRMLEGASLKLVDGEGTLTLEAVLRAVAK